MTNFRFLKEREGGGHHLMRCEHYTKFDISGYHHSAILSVNGGICLLIRENTFHPSNVQLQMRDGQPLTGGRRQILCFRGGQVEIAGQVRVCWMGQASKAR